MFYDNYVRFCNEIGKKPSAVALEIGLSKPTVNRWKNGGGITDATAAKVADYFGVSVEELTSNKNEKSPAPEGAERIPGFSDLSEENKAKALEYIALLLGSQQSE